MNRILDTRMSVVFSIFVVLCALVVVGAHFASTAPAAPFDPKCGNPGPVPNGCVTLPDGMVYGDPGSVFPMTPAMTEVDVWLARQTWDDRPQYRLQQRRTPYGWSFTKVGSRKPLVRWNTKTGALRFFAPVKVYWWAA